MKTTTDRRAQHEVCSWQSYDEAQRAVDSLADGGFPVEHLTIVGEGLRFIERITGRRGYAEAALSGLVSGGIIGAFLGFIFGLFSWIDPVISALALAVYGFLFGGAVGLVFGLVAHWVSAGRRDFSSSGSVEVERYMLVADSEELAARAARELGS